jgi:hypothetical protein
MRSQSRAFGRTHNFAALGIIALLLLTTVLSSVPAQAAPNAQAYPGSVKWDSKPKVVSNGRRSGFPRVAVDDNNVTHVIYATENGSIMYTNNRGGNFNLGGKALANSSYGAVPNVAIATGPNNTVHVAYSRPGNNNKVYYRVSPDGGVTWPDHIELSPNKAWSPDIAIDNAGNAHIVWIDNRCGEYNVFYRVRYANGSLSGTMSPRSECGTYQNRPSITFSGGMPHVVYQRGTSNAAEIYYTRLEGGSWTRPVSVSNTSTRSENPTLTSDGEGALFLAWDENVNGHDILFKASFDNGNSWSNTIAFSNSNEWASHPYADWSPSAKRVHVVWSDRTRSSDGQEEIWERQFDPATLRTTEADRVSNFNGHSYWPAIGVGPQRADIVWHDNTTGTYEIWDWGGDVIGGNITTGCEGTLRLNGETIGNSKVSRSPTLTGVITPQTGCTPTHMQISVNKPPTDSTPKQAYNANISVPTDGSCSQTVYVRLFRNEFGADAFSDSVIVDTGLTASVQVLNPHMRGVPTLPNPTVSGANDGAANYTREPRYYLNINGTADCVGVNNYRIGNGANVAITNNVVSTWLNLPTNLIGTQIVQVTVTDHANNSAIYPESIIYDNVPPTLAPGATGTMPATTNDIMVNLSFNNVNITDNQYGQREGTPGTAQFWGVLLASSTTPVGLNSNTLNWHPVRVDFPNNNFTVAWNLLTGLSNPPAKNTGGDIYVYAKFIDGAGNISSGGIEFGKITLEANYSTPILQLPTIFK